MGQPATNVSAPLVDTHAHLDFPDYDSDRDEVVERARVAGLVAIITIGIEPGDWSKTLHIANTYESVYPVLGVHPNSAGQATEEALARLESECRQPDGKRVVALGETGLDYYRNHVPHERQREAFRAHLGLARQLDLPVVIHNRDAHEDVLDILRRDGVGTSGIMHSVSGDVPFALECIKLGYMVSIAGPVTFRKAVDKHAIAAAVPLDSLLLETDCPFLTPEPFRGRRNEPSYVQYTAQAIAKLRGVSYDEVATVTTNNAFRLFGIEPRSVAMGVENSASMASSARGVRV
jgi:TatD DNase family protein